MTSCSLEYFVFMNRAIFSLRENSSKSETTIIREDRRSFFSFLFVYLNLLPMQNEENNSKLVEEIDRLVTLVLYENCRRKTRVRPENFVLRRENSVSLDEIDRFDIFHRRLVEKHGVRLKSFLKTRFLDLPNIFLPKSKEI